jgi:hypothetical protein
MRPSPWLCRVKFSDDTRRRSNDKSIVRYILGDQRSGGDDCAGADFDAGKQDGSRPYPGAFTNNDGPGLVLPGSSFVQSDVMPTSNYRHLVRNLHPVLNNYFRCRVEAAVGIDENIVPYRQMESFGQYEAAAHRAALPNLCSKAPEERTSCAAGRHIVQQQIRQGVKRTLVKEEKLAVKLPPKIL